MENVHDHLEMDIMKNMDDNMKDKKITKKQIKWIIKNCLSDLNNFRNRCRDEREVTINNYDTFNEDVFSDLPHIEYQMLISLLDDLK